MSMIRSRRIRSGFEKLEQRRLLAADVPMTGAEVSELFAFDTTGDARITPADALAVINFLAINGDESPESPLQQVMDINNLDGVTPLDALLVINRIAAAGDVGEIEFDVQQFISPGARGSSQEPVCLLDSDRDALQSFFQTLNQQRVEIGATTDEILDVVNATVTLADEAIEDPSVAAVSNLQSLFESVAQDGVVSPGEITQLRSAADTVLQSTGASLESIEPCLDGLDAIASRGISVEALQQIYSQTVDLLTNWQFEAPPQDLQQTVNELVDMMLAPDPDFEEIETAFQAAVDPDGILGQPSNLQALQLINFVSQFRSRASDGVLDDAELENTGQELEQVLLNRGIPAAEASDLVASVESILDTIDL